MINKLIEKISIYKKHIYSFEQNGMILLEKKDPSANSIINQIYKDAREILKIYNKNDIELNAFIKDALKQLAFEYNQGVVLIQDEKILIRGEIEKESVTDLMKLIFSDNRCLNEFLYSSISIYFSSIDTKLLSIREIFNISNIYKRLMSDLINLLQNDFDIQARLKSSSIKIDELNKDNNRSYEKINLVVEKILKESFDKKSGVVIGFISDLLLRATATNNTLNIKVMNHFFEKEIIESEQKCNFTTIRQNSTARERYLKLIDTSETKIKEAKAKVNEFLKIKNIEEKKVNELKENLQKINSEFNDVQKRQTTLFDKRNKLKDKNSKEYLELSSEIKNINMKKNEFDVEIKNLNSKYELSKQALLNIEEDRVDYLKLLPELIETQEKKIKEVNANLKEFEEEYLNIKRFLIKVLMKKKPNFDFEKLLQKIKKVKVKKEFCNTLADKQNPEERRFNGLPIDELEDLKTQIFKNEDNLNKFIIIVTKQALKRELNFRKISTIEFMNKNIKTIQKYIYSFLNKIIKNAQESLIEGFGNFLLRDKFNLVLTIEAEKLLKFLINDNINVKTFISYFNGDIDEDIHGKYKRPDLIDKNGDKVSITKVDSIVRRYKDYINLMHKKGELIDDLTSKFTKLNNYLQTHQDGDEHKLELIREQIKIIEHDLDIAKNKRNEFLESQKEIKGEFEELINIVANVLYKRREKLG